MQRTTSRLSGTIAQLLGSQLVRFALIGGLATLVHYAVALLVVAVTGVYGANLCGYLLAVTISYFGHQQVTFRVSRDDIDHARQLPRFAAGSLGGLAFSYIVLTLADLYGGAPSWLSLLVTVVLVPIYTFVINKLWVFRGGRDKEHSTGKRS